MASTATKAKRTVKRRPAETATIVAAIVALLAAVGVNLTDVQYQALVAVIALVPAVVTWWKARHS